MDRYGRAPSDAEADASGTRGADGASSNSLSRREFAKRAGVGSAAAAGLVWAAPKISTIRYAAKAAAGSVPPTSTTNTQPEEALGGKVTVSVASPCVGAQVRVTADGFEPGAGVAIQIDSAAHAIDMVNADTSGAIDVVVTIPTNAPTGLRTFARRRPGTRRHHANADDRDHDQDRGRMRRARGHWSRRDGSSRRGRRISRRGRGNGRRVTSSHRERRDRSGCHRRRGRDRRPCALRSHPSFAPADRRVRRLAGRT